MPLACIAGPGSRYYPPPAEGGGGTNEPGGLSVIGNFTGTVRESGGHAFGLTLFDAWFVDGGAPAANLEVVTDATNPVGSGQSLRFTFDNTYTPLCAIATGNFTAVTTLYVRFRIYLEDAFPSKYFYLGLPSVEANNEAWTARESGGEIRLVYQGSLGSIVHIDSVSSPPEGNNTQPMTTGSWHTVEHVFIADTSPGSQDGSARMWVDDIQVGLEEGNAAWGTSMSMIEWYATANSVPSTVRYRIGELYLSGA